MISTKILDMKQLTDRVKQADPSISVDSIHVEGDMTGNIVVGHGNVVGDHNLIFKINTLFGAFINLHPAAPSITRRPPIDAPHSPSRFVGRERELSLLARHIRNKEPVLLHGHSGVGKTTLLQKVANSEAAKSLPDGVLYLEQPAEGNILSHQDVLQRLFDRLFESNPPIKLTHSLHEAELVPTSPLLHVLGSLFPKMFGAKPAASIDDSLIEANLARTSPLILIDGMGKQDDRLPRLFPAGAVIVTSQNASFDDVYESIQVEPLSREEAIRLFAEKSDITADETMRRLMDQICENLKDIPLAITILANAIRQKRLKLQRQDQVESPLLLEIIFEGLQKIETLSQDPLQAAIERSFKFLYSQLTPQEREILADIASAPGKSVDREWLETEWEGAETTVKDLEASELISANSPRMRLPEGLRGVLQSMIELEKWREGLLARLLHELKDRSLDTDFVAGELGNILGILEWAFQAKRWSDVIQLGRAIDPYLTLNGSWDAWGTVLKQVEVAARNSGDAISRAWALHQLGTREIGVGTRQRAIDLLLRALDLRVRSRQFVAAAYTLHNLRFLLPPGSNGQEKGRNGSNKPKPPTLTRTYPWSESGTLLKGYGDILLATLLGAGLIAAVLMQPWMRVRLAADPARYGPAGQVIEYSYRVDNLGFRQLTGPIVVTAPEQVGMRCPDLADIGNHDHFLDWDEEIICTSFHSISQGDVERGSVTNTAIARAGDSGVEARSSFTIRRDDRYVMLGIEANPSRYEEEGQHITVSFHVSNPGTETLSGTVNVMSEKQLQATCPGTQQVSQGSVVLEAGGSLTCTATFQVAHSDVQAGSWTDTAWVSVGNFTSDKEPIMIPGPSALALSKSAAPETYQEAGQEILYTYVITNRRNVSLQGRVTVADDNVPVDCPGQDGRLDPNEQLTCTGTYITTQEDVNAGSVINTATASIGSIQSEPVTLTILRSNFDLDLVKTADPPAYQAVGQDITYSYAVSSLSKVPMKGPVTITDSLLKAPCPALNTVGNLDEFLDPDEKLTCTVTYRISQKDVDRHSVTNRAFASTLEYRSAWEWLTIYLKLPPPVLFKSADTTKYYEVGDEITYTYQVTNPGPAPLFGNVYIYDETVAVDCSRVIQVAQRSEVLAPNESVTCTGTYVIKEHDIRNGSVTNIAWAMVGNSISEPSSVTIYYDVPPGPLVLSKSAKPKVYEGAGERISYLYFLTNDGPSPLKGLVTIEDNRVRVHCPVQEILLEPGDSLTCSGIYSISSDDMASGSVTNTAQAHVGDVPSNRATETIYARGLELTVATVIESTASTVPGNYERANQVIRYSYAVTSKNRLPLAGPVTVTAIDDRTGNPVQVDCPGLSTTGNLDEFFDWKESITCTGSYSTTQDDVDALPGTDHNSVTITAVVHAGGVTSSPLSVTIPGPVLERGLVLEPMASPDTYDTVGKTITYTYVIRNLGNMTVSAPFTITDDHFENGNAFPCGTQMQRLPPKESVTCTPKTYQIVESNLDFENSQVTSNAFANAMFNGMPIDSPTATTTIACKYPHDGFPYPYVVQSNETLGMIVSWFNNTPEATTEETLRQANCMGTYSGSLVGRTLYLHREPPFATLRITVRDGDGNRLAVSPVTLYYLDTGVVYPTAYTDASGRYTFRNLKPGTYRILGAQIDLDPNENESLDFAIVPQ